MHTALPYQLTPLSKLPPELLISIFQWGVNNEFDASFLQPSNPFQSRRVPFIFRVSHVCRLWREVSRNDPTLWSALPDYNSYASNWTGESLDLSKGSLLDVQLSSGLISRNSPPSRINTLHTHTHRIRVLHGTTHSSTVASDLEQFLMHPLPSLQTLTLRYGYGAWNLSDPTVAHFPLLLRGGAPQLRTFISYRCLLDLSSPVFHQLRVLEIHALPHPFGFSTSQWLDALQAMSCLEELAITQSEMSDDTQRLVELPSLRVLRFTGDISGFGLLSQLLVPKLRDVDISVRCAQQSSSPVTHETVSRAFQRLLQGWEETLSEYILGLDLKRDRMGVQTIAASPELTNRLRLLVELIWNPTTVALTGATTLLAPLGEKLKDITSMVTHIGDLGVDTGIPLFVLSFFLSHVDQVRKWMARSCEDIHLLPRLRLIAVQTLLPSLKMVVLRHCPDPMEETAVRMRDTETQISNRRIYEDEGHINLADDTKLECVIENGGNDSRIFMEQMKMKHVATSLET